MSVPAGHQRVRDASPDDLAAAAENWAHADEWLGNLVGLAWRHRAEGGCEHDWCLGEHVIHSIDYWQSRGLLEGLLLAAVARLASMTDVDEALAQKARELACIACDEAADAQA